MVRLQAAFQGQVLQHLVHLHGARLTMYLFDLASSRTQRQCSTLLTWSTYCLWCRLARSSFFTISFSCSQLTLACTAASFSSEQGSSLAQMLAVGAQNVCIRLHSNFPKL